MGESRCPACGGLNRAGADWCGQCFHRFTPLAEPSQENGESRPADKGSMVDDLRTVAGKIVDVATDYI